MQVSDKTLEVLGKIISGDSGISPYQSGPKLVKFFNQFGSRDRYAHGFPARWEYTMDRLRSLNGTEQLIDVIAGALDPSIYAQRSYKAEVVAEHLNRQLRQDGFEVVREGKGYVVRDTRGTTADPMPASLTEVKEGKGAGEIKDTNRFFVDAQVQFCERKMAAGDYTGAIKEAGALVEAVLLEVERQITGGSPAHDGDLMKLLKRTQGLLSSEPEHRDIDHALRQIVSGLTGMITGTSHVPEKTDPSGSNASRPLKLQARLAVSAARLVADFMLETFRQQKQKR